MVTTHEQFLHEIIDAWYLSSNFSRAIDIRIVPSMLLYNRFIGTLFFDDEC